MATLCRRRGAKDVAPLLADIAACAEALAKAITRHMAREEAEVKRKGGQGCGAGLQGSFWSPCMHETGAAPAHAQKKGVGADGANRRPTLCFLSQLTATAEA